jgi:hypothetical protein
MFGIRWCTITWLCLVCCVLNADDASSLQLKIATDLSYLHELFVLRRNGECLSVAFDMVSSVLIHVPGSRTRLSGCTRSLFPFHEDIGEMLNSFLNFHFHTLQFYRTEIQSYVHCTICCAKEVPTHLVTNSWLWRCQRKYIFIQTVGFVRDYAVMSATSRPSYERPHGIACQTKYE